MTVSRSSIVVSILLMVQLYTAAGQNLTISANGRYLTEENGSPFFYLGDTAWELFHRLSLKEAEVYLENRAEKGFTVVQAVVLSQLGGLSAPNANGDLPLENNDPNRPLEPYFQHIDAVVAKAESLGIVVGMFSHLGKLLVQHQWKRDHFYTRNSSGFWGVSRRSLSRQQYYLDIRRRREY